MQLPNVVALNVVAKRSCFTITKSVFADPPGGFESNSQFSDCIVFQTWESLGTAQEVQMNPIELGPTKKKKKKKIVFNFFLPS